MIEVWGGIECTINRVGDTFFDQLELNGHYTRTTDIKAIADLGIRYLRYPILWERHQPQRNAKIDWSWADARLQELREHNIVPIAGLGALRRRHPESPRHGVRDLTDPGISSPVARSCVVLCHPC